MAILKIARMGHPSLRTPAAEVSKREINLPMMQQLVDDMIESMEDHNGIGLAAPQVHVSKKLFVVQVPEITKAPKIQPFPLTIVFNPKLNFESDEKIEMWEGCLSIPDIRGKVPRFNKLTMTYLDRKGKEQRLVATGFLSGVIQHETDHLNAILFFDRMTRFETLSFTEEWARYMFEDLDHDEGTVTFL